MANVKYLPHDRLLISFGAKTVGHTYRHLNPPLPVETVEHNTPRELPLAAGTCTQNFLPLTVGPGHTFVFEMKT